MFMQIDYYFQGLTYIIVYVGAIAILFQFVIMMVPVYPVTTSSYILSDINMTPNMDTSLGKRSGENQTMADNNPKVLQTNHKQDIQQNRLQIILGILILLILPIHYSQISYNYLISAQDVDPARICMIGMDIYCYFYPSWVIEYKTLTDIESQAILIYVAYPTAQLLIGTALWTVMIGIISICSPRN